MPKFLVLNPDPRDLDDVLAKANLQNTKNGPFEAVLLLGDVMSDLESVPATEVKQRTYFGRGPALHTRDSEAEGTKDIKDNLTFLGNPLNILTLTSGFTLAIVSADLSKVQQDEILAKHKNDDTLLKVDILVSYLWPNAIAKENKLSLVGDSSSFVDELVKLTRPRYHFAVGSEKGRFYERQPFKWEASVNGSTRFISLGQKGSGEKWFYAFSIDNTPIDVSSETSLNPFEALPVPPIIASLPAIPNKRGLEEVDPAPRKRKQISTSQCFFCLSNPRCETHMVICIGSHNYMTVAKGPLTQASRNSPLDFSGHVIIIPIEHISTNREAVEGNQSVTETPVYKEYIQFQDALVSSFQKYDFTLVFFEINRSSNVHHHTQMVPVPNNLIQAFESSLNDRETNNNEKFVKNSKLKFVKFEGDIAKEPKLSAILNESDYILFTICNKNGTKTYFISKIDEQEGKGIDLQFPRRVLASVLRCAKRVYWEKCRQTLDEETQESERFKRFFKDHDFTA